MDRLNGIPSQQGAVKTASLNNAAGLNIGSDSVHHNPALTCLWQVLLEGGQLLLQGSHALLALFRSGICRSQSCVSLLQVALKVTPSLGN